MEGVEHARRVVAGAHPEAEVGVVGVGEPVHRLEGDDGGRVRARDGVVEDAAAADGGELVAVTDERDAGAGLVGDGEERAGGVLVEHSGLVDEQQVTEPAAVRPRRGWGRGCRVQWPSSSQRQPCWWISQAAECPSAPVSAAATSAAFNVGVTTTSRCPCWASSLSGGPQRGGLPGAGGAFDHHQLAVAGQGADHRCLGRRRS